MARKIKSKTSVEIEDSIVEKMEQEEEYIIPYSLESRIRVEKPEIYILDLALNSRQKTFAVSLSNHTIKLFSNETKANIATLEGHEKKITGIAYSKKDPNLLYSSSQDGNIRLWDTRKNEDPVKVFTDTSGGSSKPVLSFDVSLDGNYICAGTEVIREDAFLVFWDYRTTKNLGGFWNCHNDDITQVKYHPHCNYALASGSVDGLINILHLAEGCEDDALHNTLNTESSVANITWKSEQIKDIDHGKLICLTHVEEIQAWRVNEPYPYRKLDRESLKDYHKDTEVDYMVGTLQDEDQVFLVSGNRRGKLQIWSMDDNNVKLWSQIDNAHKEDTRAIAWNHNDRLLYTGGEDGTVCIWSSKSQPKLKIKPGKPKHGPKRSSKPY